MRLTSALEPIYNGYYKLQETKTEKRVTKVSKVTNLSNAKYMI